MKIRKRFLIVLIGLVILGYRQASADTEDGVVEVLRGEEVEAELELEGTEAIYALYGNLTGDAAFISFGRPAKKVVAGYQALVPDEKGETGSLLLSRLGLPKKENLRFRIRIQGKRIGEATLWLSGPQYVSADGKWLENVTFPEIKVNVLPNPLEVYVSGAEGNAGWYIGEPEVRIVDKDAAEMFYAFGEAEEVRYTAPFLVPDGAWEIHVRTDDGYGYRKDESITVPVDTKKPVITASKRSTEWQDRDILVTLRATDSTSGVYNAVRALSESKDTPGDYQQFTDSTECRIEEDGIWYLHVFAEDVAGNTTQWVYGPYQKDTVAPEIVIENMSAGDVFTEGILPEITFTDFSGIAKTEYYLDGRAWSLTKITGRGKHTLTVAATDMAGNRAEKSVEFFIYDPVNIAVLAEDSRYTGTAVFTATVTYDKKPLADRTVMFYVNGEAVGEAVTNRYGTAWLLYPVEIAPQEAVVTAVVATEEENYFAETQGETKFFVAGEYGVVAYTGELAARNGEMLHLQLEAAELPGLKDGDITKAVFDVSMAFVEEDGSRTMVETRKLSPDENGRIFWEGMYETGLYELKISFAEESWYQGNELLLYPGIYDVQAIWEDGAGQLQLDLPHVGLKVLARLAFLPVPELSAEVNVRIPGTGVMLTANEVEGWNLTEEGLKLTGKAYNSVTGEVYRYELRVEFSYGIFVTKLEAFVWEGEEPEEGSGEEADPNQPIYEFKWELAELTEN